MALTVIKRPQGAAFNFSAAQTATVTSSSGALFTKTGHGLSTNDFIYIDSNFSAYNGIWQILKNDNDSFWIREYATATVQAFINSGSVTYYTSSFTHGWSSVHLPIVYKLSSTLWPTNTADTVRTISSISNDNGNVNLNLSGDIKATGSAAELEFVQVFGQNAGIYQIINWYSDSDITIDMPYSAGVSFTASTIQYYYNNYHARIKVYGGLVSSHYWTGQKPYEEIATLKIVPDTNGILMVNISDLLKTKIEIDKNNTALDTLPNDIDSFCMFYITAAEAYDTSNGYTLGTNVGSETSDQSNFEGFAINAALPFKNIYSGFMSEYVMGATAASSQKFLSAMNEPEIFDGQYFDLSFIINSTSSGFYVLEQRVSNGVVTQTLQTNISDYDQGVYRHQITYDATYDSVRVSVYDSGNNKLSETKTIIINKNCGSYYTDLVWKNYLGGHDYWRFNAGAQLSINSRNKETITNIFTNWPKSYGEHADTIRKNAMVESSKNYLLRSQYVNYQQAEDIINGVESALLVQVQTSDTKKRTVMVESSNKLEETDKLVELQFKIRYTNDNPVQSL